MVDLHVHSVFSDGTFTPEEIIKEAEAKGIFAVALTDHNTFDGVEEFMKAAKNSKVSAVPGIEFSTGYLDKELHIVALFVRKEQIERVNEVLCIEQRKKDESNRLLLERLNNVGYDIKESDLKAKHRFNRAHVAAALTEKGYTSSIKEAFDTLLKEEHGFYQPPKRLDVFKVLELINEINAVSVLAHPLLNLTRTELPIFLNEAEKYGLVAMEVFYSEYIEDDIEFSKSLAKEYGLYMSGGSDFHGSNKPDIQLGIGKGNLIVPSVPYLQMYKYAVDSQMEYGVEDIGEFGY